MVTAFFNENSGTMEDAPLNRAHQCEAVADSHFRSKKFEKAIEFRTKAEKYFQDCLQQTRNPIVTESLQAQIEENHRQINYIKRIADAGVKS